jgi:poly(hydroxyalkanoate) granule-associated protein
VFTFYTRDTRNSDDKEPVAMSEANRAVAERWVAALASGAPDAVLEVTAPDVALYGIGAPVRGRASVSSVFNLLRSAFPDLRLETENLACEGAWVTVRFRATGTQHVPLFGLRSGEARDIAGVACLCVGDTGITQVWLYADAAQLVTQFDLRPARAMAEGIASSDPSESWLERITGGAREIWLAGIGALGATGEQGERLFHALVEQGRTLESSSRERLSETAAMIDSNIRVLADRARHIASSGEGYVRDMAADAHGRLSSPTREEFQALNEKVDRLLARLDAAPGPASDTANQSAGESTSSKRLA